MFPKERTLQCETCLEPLLSRKSDQIEKASTRLRIFTDTTEKLIQHLINPSIIDGNSSLTEVNQQVDIIMLHYHKEES